MAEGDKLFAGSIPEFYDALMVPLVFADYAVDMAALVAASSPGSVLETAAGSGAVTRAIATVFPHDPPRFLARTPHGYRDAALIRAELSRAGFAAIAIATLAKVSRAATARDAATVYCLGTPLRNEIETRDAGLLGLATDRAAEAVAERHGDGPVAGKIQAHVIAATR